MSFFAAAAAAGLSACLYLAAGAGSAYLITDDFQWLLGGRHFDWGLLSPTVTGHFYRPTTILYFAGAARVCGADAGCYHYLNIALHALNVLLVFAIVRRLTRRDPIAFVAALLFGVNPAFVQAVAWVSAATALLAAAGMLAATWLQVTAWDASQASRRWREAAAITAFFLAVFAHEAAAVWPLISLMLWRTLSPPGARWRTLAIGSAAVLAVFAVTAIAASRENYVFRDGLYTAGPHMLRNAFDYLVSLWVGPHRLWAYLATLPLLAAFAWTPLSRVGLAWMLVTLIPYLGFTWANAGRYTYLPAIGLAIGLAGLLQAAMASSRARSPRWRAAAWAIVAVLALRFGVFTLRGARGDFAAFEPPRAYLLEIDRQGRRPEAGVIRVPRPADSQVDVRYLELMLQWHFRDPRLRVVLD